MRAINASVMRKINRKLILDQIRSRPISRAELAEITHLTRASVTQIIEELLDEGIVIETKVVGRMRLGRRSTQLEIAPNAGIVFGVNIGRRQCCVGAVNMHGEVLVDHTLISAGRTADEVVDEVVAVIRSMCDELAVEPTKVFGVGICLPGPADSRNGVVIDPAGMEAWHHMPVRDMLASQLGMNVVFDSAVNAMALEEKYFNDAGDTFALITVSEDVEAGIVANGSLYRGAEHRPLEIGGYVIEAGQTDGHLAERVADPAVLNATQYHTWSDLFAHEGDPDVSVVETRFIEGLSAGIINLALSFAVNRIVLRCEAVLINEAMLARINECVRSNPAGRRMEVTSVGSHGCVRTAAALVYDDYFCPSVEE